MKKIIYFTLGAFVGLIISIAILYTSGYILESLDMLLYESEADQQRNFNIFLVVSVLISIIGGVLFVKKIA